MHLGGVRIAAVGVLVLLAFGCGLRGGKGSRDRAAVNDRMAQHWAHKVCDDGVAPGATCGTIAEEVFSPASRKDFIVSICREPFGPMSPGCRTRFDDMWAARLEERYSFAPQSTIGIRCRAHPKECGDPAVLEEWFREAHNGALLDKAGAELKTIEEKEEDRANTRRAIAEAMASYPQRSPTLHCTSRTSFGGREVETNCQ